MPEKHFSGKYKVTKLLNNGKYAKVYHARDTRSGQEVAIKSFQSPDNLNVVEIQAMSRLSHRHVIKLKEVKATADGEVFVITEFARCGDLFEMISKRGPFNEDLSRLYFQQLISSVKYCHSQGVYHRDIKPENLLLDDKWRVKLSDFGLSAVIDDPTRPGPVLTDPCGTVEYAAPEVIMAGRGGGYDGAKADVWSCGVVLYVMIAGFLPFDNGDLVEMVGKMNRGEFRLLKKMSTGLKWLLLRLLDPNPETRISVDEIIEDKWFRQGYEEPSDDE
ncbi:CBL-interacting serine/threonine-protein kinase 11-like [Amaranthus tricolor]|uniref:CBL-interacting serine/threonine-protein kinase 11-like n=1 Tax=Amaranthus tricolor TaxID=29722 RepID=UPI0025896EB7|nr:CBL-interacting serine/threonine-protein kinase 11-like [Amaranthus tricolor]